MNKYKVNHLTHDNTLSSIHVFYGKHKKDLNELFKNDPGSKEFIDIFNEEELTHIVDNNIPIIFSPQVIHFDDTIGVIKSKIMRNFKDTFSLEEMYMFCMKKEKLNSTNTYQLLTQNNKIVLTRARLDNFLLNIIRDSDGVPFKFDLPEKDIYTYDDIITLNINNKIFWINQVLGQQIILASSEYPFVCNPFQVVTYDTLIERNIRKSLTTLNNHLLLNTGNIIGNNIYLCTALDVLEYNDSPTTIKLYYPFLYDKNINTIDKLTEFQTDLIETSKKHYTEHIFNTINLFYDVYQTRKTQLNYKQYGIKSLKIIIHPKYNVKVPLDVIFKFVNATSDTPLIRYNPGLRQDKMYRLHTDKVAINGKKIPSLSKGTIFKLIKIMGTHKSIAIYIQKLNGICEIEEKGKIYFYTTFENLTTKNDIESLLHNYLNPVLDIIKSQLELNGYSMPLFENLQSDNIEIKQMQYQTIIGIDKSINLKSLAGCVSSIFVIESNNVKNGKIDMRFKRVANFNKKTSMEAFIIEKQKEGATSIQIIESLLENYKELKENDAIELLAKVATEIQVEQGQGVRKGGIEIKINPGFKTTITLNQITSEIIINVENINDIFYLQTIPIYLDTLIRLTQNKNTSKVSVKEINKFCNLRDDEKYIVEIEDIIPLENRSYIEQNDTLQENKGIMLDENDIVFENNDGDNTFESENDIINDPDELEKGQKILNLFFRDDEESDEESNEESNKNNTGGASSGNKNVNIVEEDEENSSDSKDVNNDAVNIVKNIDGMHLNNPYIFQQKIVEKDPVLILSEKQGKYNPYSRICQQNTRRQPVILTDEELQKIKDTHPGVLNEDSDIIKYGSSVDKQYNYICPRYWDLLNDTLITQDEIKDKKLEDKIIPVNDKIVSKGQYIYEFTPPKDSEKYPGFITDSHPNKHCLPCCFLKWNVPSQIQRKKECAGTKIDTDKQSVQSTQSAHVDDYIVGPGKFPLGEGRWGYLPMGVQNLLREVNSTCQPNKSCLLRHGVEISNIQSFIACIADALFYTKQKESVSITKMKNIIISILNLDNFVTYQNGNLVSDFANPNKNVDITLPKYTDTKLFKNLKNGNTPYFQRVCNAFENFIEFLQNDDIFIDYTYLWDIISTPHPNLFVEGINLVILDIPNMDITDNVNLICPTNHYHATYYDATKPTLLLYHQDKYFEPIYTYRKDKDMKTRQDTLYVGKFFKENNPNLSKQIKYLFDNIITPYYKNMCSPLSSMPNVYKAKTPILLPDLITILNEYKYKIIKQVVNYQTKVIGLVVETSIPTRKEGFIPCYPSSINEKIDFIFMMEPTIWHDYKETTNFLLNVYRTTLGKVPCNPAFKVIEDEVIVGIITETNQFIQLSQPIPVSETNDEIRELRNNNYVVNKENNPLISSDAIITSTDKIDEKREDYIIKIKLETSFFQIFRNTIRMLLNDYSNLKIRESIEREIKLPYTIYNEKLKTTIELLNELINDMVVFVDDYDYKLIKDVNTCIVNQSPEKCEKNSPLCAVTSNQRCQLILPKHNLLTNSDNEVNYYLKMADELIRYTRIKSFMFEPQIYLSFGRTDYNLKDDEIIMLQSLLTQEYFEELVPANINKYAKYNSYDEAEPSKTHIYSDSVKVE